MTAPQIPQFTGDEPVRDGSQTPTQFSINTGQFLGFIGDLGDYYNNLSLYLDGLAVDVDSLATDAENSATASAASASEAADSVISASAVTNYIGEWSTLSGAESIGVTVSHDGAFWRLLVDVADIASTEPSGSNSDWLFVSGSRWQLLTSNASLAVNSQVQVVTSTAVIDVTLPVFNVSDFIVVHNSLASSYDVKIVNNGYTIKGEGGEALSADNIILNTGDTIHLVARTLTELEIV